MRHHVRASRNQDAARVERMASGDRRVERRPSLARRDTNRNAPRREARRAVALVAGDDDLPLLAKLHAEEALVPALDHLPDARLVREGLLSRVLGRPELLTRLLDHTGGMHSDCGTLGDRRARSLLQNGVLGTIAAGSRVDMISLKTLSRSDAEGTIQFGVRTGARRLAMEAIAACVRANAAPPC